jgi:hypothetical protein
MSKMLSAQACQDFKNEVMTGSVSSALKKLDALKVILHPSFNIASCRINTEADFQNKYMLIISYYQEALLECGSPFSSTSESDISIAREALEYAVILSVKAGDKGSFQRYMSCLKPLYTSGKIQEPTDQMNVVVGLNLLYLLVENRLADYHCEVCTLSK